MPGTMQHEDVTPQTRIMLPAYVIFFSWTGLSYIFTALPRLLLSPSLKFFNHQLNLRVWGAISIFVAACLVYAWIFPGRQTARPTASYVLLLGMIVMGIWMLFLMGASIFGQAAPGAGAYAFLPMMACYATYRSIKRVA